MSMRSSLRVGTIFGIPIKIHISFLIILPLFAFAFGFTEIDVFGFRIGYGDLPIDDIAKASLGLLAAILFFISVLLHELAHSLVALRNGYKLSGITLFIFGGASEIEKTPPNAPGEAYMAFVGPGTSILIGLILLPLWLLLSGVEGLFLTIVAITVSMMSFYNLLLGGFNIIPAFPMDGGRILRAFLAKRMSFMRATSIAVSVGKGIAVVMAIVGFFINIWLILIALFIYLGAREEERGTYISTALEGVTVGRIMTREVSTVAPSSSVRQLLDKMMVEKHLGYPVTDGQRVVGIVTLQDAQRIPAEQQDITTVDQVMSREVLSVNPETPAMDAIQLISSRGIGRLVVLEGERLVGIVSRSDLMRTLEIRAAEEGGAGAKA